jgi:hypothetical protein
MIARLRQALKQSNIIAIARSHNTLISALGQLMAFLSGQ